MLGVISGFDPFTGNLRFCWLSVAHTVMQVSWTSGQTYFRAPRTDFIPAMCPCALLVLMSAYAGTDCWTSITTSVSSVLSVMVCDMFSIGVASG